MQYTTTTHEYTKELEKMSSEEFMDHVAYWSKRGWTMNEILEGCRWVDDEEEEVVDPEADSDDEEVVDPEADSDDEEEVELRFVQSEDELTLYVEY